MQYADPAMQNKIQITARQLELLAMYSSGYTLAEIGEIKFLSVFTVRNNLLLAQKRAEAKNLTHLCMMCYAAGLIKATEAYGFYEPVQEDRVA